MPSSPSTRIRLELQAAGENLNTWGAPKLNSALQRLEEAIDGRFAKVLTTNYTLVASNYVSDEARMAFLDFSGSPTSPCTVTVPSVEKTYLVRNATAGDLVITTGSGTTVTLHTGTTSVLAVDGTNVRTVGANADDVATALASAKAYTDAAAIGAGNLPSASGLADYTLATGPTGGGSSGTPAWVSAVNMRLKLGLGSAATQNTGTSGTTVPLLDGVNTWSGVQTLNAAPVFGDQSGSRTALGLGGAATRNVGTTSADVAAGDHGVPTGAIIAWSGASTAIPTGYVLCNGLNGTPDLRDRFIVGAAGAYAVGATGGATSVTPTISVAGTALSIAQLPSHDHGFSQTPHTHTDAGHAHTINGGGALTAYQAGAAFNQTGASFGTAVTGVTDSGQAAISSSSANITFSAQGSGATHTHTATSSAIDPRPPYYALCWIMKT